MKIIVEKKIPSYTKRLILPFFKWLLFHSLLIYILSLIYGYFNPLAIFISLYFLVYVFYTHKKILFKVVSHKNDYIFFFKNYSKIIEYRFYKRDLKLIDYSNWYKKEIKFENNNFKYTLSNGTYWKKEDIEHLIKELSVNVID